MYTSEMKSQQLLVQMESQDDEVVVMDFNEQQAMEMERQHIEGTKRFLEDTEPYRIEKWYSILEKDTFKSVFLELKPLQAYGIHCLYYSEPISEETAQSLKDLEDKVSKMINVHFPQGCFSKLSTRSPKDYMWDFRSEDAFKLAVQSLSELLLSHHFDKIQPRKPTIQEWNLIYRSLLQLPKRRMKISQGSDLIDMFSKSERVVIDINQLQIAGGMLFKQFKEGNYCQRDAPFIKISLREWEEFPWESEFRCFYNNFQLNAITPYVQDAVYSINEPLVKEKISQFFGSIESRLETLNLGKGVMDVCFLGNGTIKLVEINAFDENSRGSLFDWKADRDILLNGPLTMRTRKEYPEDILVKMETMMGMLEKGAKKVVSESCNRVNPSLDISDVL